MFKIETIVKNPLMGATLMITGCCIGAGMIGLPVMSALAGFIPSVLAMLLCYFFTTFTGLMLLEATLWFDKQVNLPSIVEFALGKIGKVMTIILFLSLFYCLFVAYLDAGGSLFSESLSHLLHLPVPHFMGVLLCMGFIFALTYAGTVIADGFNRSMLIGMIISYFILVAVGLPHVSQENLLYRDWKATSGVVPILLLCFGYHNLVPSITYYLNKNVNAVRLAIVVGNFIPFLIYFLWDYVILGMLPIAQAGTKNEAQMVMELLQKVAIPSVSVIFFVKIFSLFAILTSFLPSAVSFADFLKDGFKKLSHGKVRTNFMMYGLVFFPPTLCALFYPRLFLQALGFAGGFIDVLLFGILPALVILVGRRMRKGIGDYQVIGGSITPFLILILSVSLLLFKLNVG